MSRFLAVLFALPWLLSACNDHPLAAPQPEPEKQTDKLVAIDIQRKVDILFVVDNSFSMKQEQDNLARNFPAFIDKLRNIEGGLPDVHIAVVTTDVGAGPGGVTGCKPPGQDGAFQGWDRACGLDPGSRYLVAADGEQTRNYQGDLSKVFGCMAKVGVQGCGYEHPLEALRRALTVPHGPESAGFLREDALLQIVLITDEDDCSAPGDSDLFTRQFPDEEPSFRCARAGHTCQGQMIPAGDFRAPLTECQPVENGALSRVADFVAAVKAVKKNPERIWVAGIFGWPVDGPGEYRVGRSAETGKWDYLSACHSENGDATAALRLKQFVDAFGANSFAESICQGDFRPALEKMADKLIPFIDVDFCVEAPLVDTSPAPGVQADCLVSDSVPAAGGYAELYLPTCDAGKPGSCWKLVPDSQMCSGSGFRVEIERKGQPVTPETRVAIKCRTCVRPEDPRCQR